VWVDCMLGAYMFRVRESVCNPGQPKGSMRGSLGGGAS
jgi:hypothetical protein